MKYQVSVFTLRLVRESLIRGEFHLLRFPDIPRAEILLPWNLSRLRRTCLIWQRQILFLQRLLTRQSFLRMKYHVLQRLFRPVTSSLGPFSQSPPYRISISLPRLARNLASRVFLL